MWWKSLTRSKAVEADARKLIELLGAQAYESARDAARRSRSKDKLRAKHFSRVALRIAELTGREIGVDTATRMVERIKVPRIGGTP